MSRPDLSDPLIEKEVKVYMRGKYLLLKIFIFVLGWSI
jgi:hypothetical protein